MTVRSTEGNWSFFGFGKKKKATRRKASNSAKSYQYGTKEYEARVARLNRSRGLAAYRRMQKYAAAKNFGRGYYKAKDDWKAYNAPTPQDRL